MFNYFFGALFSCCKAWWEMSSGHTGGSHRRNQNHLNRWLILMYVSSKQQFEGNLWWATFPEELPLSLYTMVTFIFVAYCSGSRPSPHRLVRKRYFFVILAMMMMSGWRWFWFRASCLVSRRHWLAAGGGRGRSCLPVGASGCCRHSDLLLLVVAPPPGQRW